jgi:MFS family permease
VKAIKDQNEGQPLYRDLNLNIVFLVSLSAILGTNLITPAFPEMPVAFNISEPRVDLLVAVFVLPGVLLIPVLGMLADRFGRKRILVPSLLLFGIAGGACSLARDFNTLLAFRFLQGIGAASLGSLTITIIGDLYSGRHRAAARGYNASVCSIGAVIAPIIGGALAALAWFVPFVVSVIAVPVGIIALFSLKSPEPKRHHEFKQYLNNVYLGIKNRQVLCLFSISLFTAIILIGIYVIHITLFLGDKLHATPFFIGIIMSSAGLTNAITCSQFGKLARRYSEKTLIKAAFVIYPIPLHIIPFVHNVWLFLIPSAIFGIAEGMCKPSIQTLLAGFAPIEHRATFMSIKGTLGGLGALLGPLLMAAIFIIGGYEGTFFACAGLTFVMLIMALVVLK